MSNLQNERRQNDANIAISNTIESILSNSTFEIPEYQSLIYYGSETARFAIRKYERETGEMYLPGETSLDNGGTIDKLAEQGLPIKRHRVAIADALVDATKRTELGIAFFEQGTDAPAYIYSGTMWRPINNATFNDYLRELCKSFGIEPEIYNDVSYQERLREQIRDTFFVGNPNEIARGVSGSEPIMLNLANGTLETGTDGKPVLRDFSRSDYFTYQLAFNYEPQAKGNVFIDFLNEVIVNPDGTPDIATQKLLAEAVASVFIPNSVMKLEKVPVLLGSGANGKSVVFEVIQALLGAENVSHYSLQLLTAEKGYYRRELEHKLLNYCPELDVNGISTGLFKQLASREPVSVEVKYGNPYSCDTYARLMFNANQYPYISEKTHGLFRRLMFIPFTVTIPFEKRDNKLANKIIQTELPGVLNWVLSGLKRLLKQGDYSKSPAVEQALDTYKLQSNSVAMFAEDEDGKIDKETPLKEYYSSYKDFCFTLGYKQYGYQRFREQVRDVTKMKLIRKRNVWYATEPDNV